MSLDETASLHEGFKEMMTWLTGNRVFGDGSIWWVAAYFFTLGVIGTRLVADMCECGLSTIAMFAVALCYVSPWRATRADPARIRGPRRDAGRRGGDARQPAAGAGDAAARPARCSGCGGSFAGRAAPIGMRTDTSTRPATGLVKRSTKGISCTSACSQRGRRLGRSSRPCRWSKRSPPLGRKLTKQEKRAMRFRLEQGAPPRRALNRLQARIPNPE